MLLEGQLWVVFFFSSRRRHTRWTGDWSSDVCSSDLSSRLAPLHVAEAPVVAGDGSRDLRGDSERDRASRWPEGRAMQRLGELGGRGSVQRSRPLRRGGAGETAG